ncbi:MAG: DUF5011 domain-containing protein [Bacteroidetes bacterium]|nr:DUF5011 domain-containing protein [Bacteroidota bacterium]MBU1717450.1 DUF5011 domain-containing protein [Bacteroidota bacterium]
MNKLIILIFVTASTFLLLISCRKDDATPPQITLSGEKSMLHILNAPFTDPGATANDNKDGDRVVTSDADSVINIDSVAVYAISYTASDESGNIATETRTVEVYNESRDVEGAYQATDIFDGDTVVFNEYVSASHNLNNKISFSKFAYFTNATVYAMISGTTVTIPSQSHICGPDSAERTFAGQGSINGNTISVSYTVSLDSATLSGSCVYVKN